MNDLKKLKDILNCPQCSNKFDTDSHVPKLLPCGKTMCDDCIEKKLERKSNNKNSSFRDNCFYLTCKFCSEDHQLTKNGFPKNELLIAILNNSDYDEDFDSEQDDENEKSDNLRNKSEKYRKTNSILNEIDLNSKNLETCLNTSKDKLAYYFDSIEKEIDSHTDKLIDELKLARENLIKELKLHKKSALEYLNEGLNEKSNLQMFRSDCKKEHAKLLKLAKLNEKNEHELRHIGDMADELNEKIIKTRVFIENSIKSDLKFFKSKYKIDRSTIGRLEFKKVKYNTNDINGQIYSHRSNQSSTNTTPRERISETKTSIIELNRIKTVNYSRVPFNTKNVQTSVLNNKLIVKVTEQSIIEDYSYKINLKLMNSDGGVIRKLSEEMGSYRLKKIQTSTNNNYIGIIFTNKFLDNFNCLKLYDGNQLKLIETIDLHYTPIDIFMSKSGIYIRSNNYNLNINKYDYSLRHVKSFGQAVNTNDPFYIPQSAKLSFIQDEKLYFIDYENSKIRILNETSGKYMKPLLMDDTMASSKNVLIFVDTHQRITLITRLSSKLYMKIFNSEHVLLDEKKITDIKCDSLDQFFVLNDTSSGSASIYSIIDKKNQSINFF